MIPQSRIQLVKRTPAKVLSRYLRHRGLQIDRQTVKGAMGAFVQAIMDVDVTRRLEASPYERNDARRAYRNGYRDSIWQTDSGDIAIRIPKLRKGTYYPSFLDTQSQFAGILEQFMMDALIRGVENDILEVFLETNGFDYLRHTEIAELHEQITDVLNQYHMQPVASYYSELQVDVLDVEIERQGRVLHHQLVVILGVDEDGEQKLLSHDLVTGVDTAYWRNSINTLIVRGLQQVDNLVSDDYPGLRRAMDMLVGVTWELRRAFAAGGAALYQDRREPIAAVTTLFGDTLTQQPAKGTLKLVPRHKPERRGPSSILYLPRFELERLPVAA